MSKKKQTIDVWATLAMVEILDGTWKGTTDEYLALPLEEKLQRRRFFCVMQLVDICNESDVRAALLPHFLHEDDLEGTLKLAKNYVANIKKSYYRAN